MSCGVRFRRTFEKTFILRLNLRINGESAQRSSGCRVLQSSHNFEAGSAIMIGTFPESGLILSGHGTVVCFYSPIPFFVIRAADMFFYKVPAIERTLPPDGISAELPGLKETHHCFGLRPPVFLPDQMAVFLFIPESSVGVQAFCCCG